MSIIEITSGRHTHGSLMNKSKSDLAYLCLQIMDLNAAAIQRAEKAEAGVKKIAGILDGYGMYALARTIRAEVEGGEPS